MHRIDAANHVDNLFTEGNPATGASATTVSGAWLNDVQENIARVIERADLPLTKGRGEDLADAVDLIARRWAGGRVDNLADLRTAGRSGDAAVGVACMRVRGYYAGDSKGGGVFRWDSASEAADDAGLVIRPDDVPENRPGRWLRLTDGQTYNIEWWGVFATPAEDVDAAAAAARTRRVNAVLKGFVDGDAASARQCPVSLHFPAGVYRFHGAIGYWGSEATGGTGDTRTYLQLTGDGRRVTQFNQLDPTAAVFELKTTSGNIRDFVMTDITLVNGAIGIDLERADYNLFRNVVFNRQRQYGVRAHIGGIGNEFVNCWWVHLHGNSILADRAATIRVFGGMIGEDAGAVESHGSARVELVGTCVWDITDHSRPNGPADMGKAMFVVGIGAELRLASCWIASPRREVDFLFMNNVRDVLVNDCRIVVRDGRKLINVRALHRGPAPFSPFRFAGNHVIFEGSGVFYEAQSPDSSLRNALISGNTIDIPEGATVEMRDWLFDPARNNFLDGNVIRERTGR